MKKILITLIVSVSLVSCTKLERKKCWECTLNYAVMVPKERTTTVCDKTRTEIDEMIKYRYLIMDNDSARFFMECH